ncbi:hypothetical protein IE81DRAFT_331323 [Ceraceosorus guamensis]|uniref:Cell wall protein n=1 Tax=Ceraceosorus guamensis TaxID=1522189 RepID=A0A316VUI5_9BASI|nr:hypothetical protein IE81DRAFT_331323 [Ceraceosorus guamensis]PWN40904.1 hypothetical protein IE81DRAFT_331323 [Ceraceosorus guamensis]
MRFAAAIFISLAVVLSSVAALPLGKASPWSIAARDNDDGPNIGSQAFALTVDSVNQQLDTFAAGFQQFLAGDFEQGETLQLLLNDLTDSIHAGADALSDPAVHIEGKEVQGVQALLNHAESTVNATIESLIEAQYALLMVGAAKYIYKSLPALGRAFESFKDLSSIQSYSHEHSQSDFSAEVHKKLDRIVGWINVGLNAFGRERISAAWIEEKGIAPCDQYTDKGVVCKPKEEHLESQVVPEEQTQTQAQAQAQNRDQTQNQDQTPGLGPDGQPLQLESDTTTKDAQPVAPPTKTIDGQPDSKSNGGDTPQPETLEPGPPEEPSRLTQAGNDGAVPPK